MKFVVATKDYAGLGFAIRLKDEGHEVVLGTNPGEEDQADPERLKAFDLVGTGMVDKAPLADLMSRREQMRDWYWIWDFNHAVDQNETLRAEKFKVLGGGHHANMMEHDRPACLEFAATYGLEAPASFPFTDVAEAVRFCEANPQTAYVYKPDEGANFETFLPESEEPADANLEMRMHLQSIGEPGAFILQERKEGVETNVEVWMQDGGPVFAFMTLESKKKYVMDMGELVGCAFDFSFIIPLDCKAVTESVGKLYPAYKKMRYTGFADANFIASRDGLWFFENASGSATTRIPTCSSTCRDAAWGKSSQTWWTESEARLLRRLRRHGNDVDQRESHGRQGDSVSRQAMERHLLVGRL